LLSDDFLNRLSAGDRIRLRILIIARAFGVGWEVWDLVEVGRAAPAIGRVLNIDDIDGLARLKLLWKMRPDRPWRRCGPAITVFDLAGYPVLGGHYLESAPDLLLYQPTTPPIPPLARGGPPAPILVCGRGVKYDEVLLRSDPGSISVRARPLWQGGGFEIVLGRHRLAFREDPDALARKLEKWTNYYCKQFLPLADGVISSRSDDRLRTLLNQRIVTCPECHRQFVGRERSVGITVSMDQFAVPGTNPSIELEG
jgi:hypothetical protein